MVQKLWRLQRNQKPEFTFHFHIDKFQRLRQTVADMKNDKSPGTGGVPIKLIKHGFEMLFKLLVYIFNACLRGQGIPILWIRGHISNF